MDRANILVIDIGGTNVKLWHPESEEKFKFPSGKTLQPERLVEQTRRLLERRRFDRVSIGYPGEVIAGRPVKDPYNLGPGWTRFDFAEAFRCPVRWMNDACMQALGSYQGGRMLYLGLGTGVGTTFMSEGRTVPLALGHLRFTKRLTLDAALSRRGLKRFGPRRWGDFVTRAADALRQAFLADYVVLGGGNAKKLPAIPPHCRRGSNFNAYLGGLRMWGDQAPAESDDRDVSPLLKIGTIGS